MCVEMHVHMHVSAFMCVSVRAFMHACMRVCEGVSVSACVTLPCVTWSFVWEDSSADTRTEYLRC